MFSIEKKIIVITGVSGQMGNEYASFFLEQGAMVIGLDITLSSNETFLNNNNYLFVKTDITSKKSIEEALKKIKNQFGIPDILINNAGLDSPPSSSGADTGAFEDYPEASWDKVIDVNLKGVFLCCQVFGKAMTIKKSGSIINIASIYGLVSPDQNIYKYKNTNGNIFYKPVAYSASKSGVLNLTRYLATYWAKQNIRVNTLTIAGVFNNQDDEFLEEYCNRIPIGRMAKQDDYNGALLFLASNQSSYMTGSNLIIDGGWTAI